MKLECTRGCNFNTKQMWHAHLKPGDRCPNILTYDLLATPSTTYCRRVLREVKEESNVPNCD